MFTLDSIRDIQIYQNKNSYRFGESRLYTFKTSRKALHHTSAREADRDNGRREGKQFGD
jgi:hypothetical protein